MSQKLSKGTYAEEPMLRNLFLRNYTEEQINYTEEPVPRNLY